MECQEFQIFCSVDPSQYFQVKMEPFGQINKKETLNSTYRGIEKQWKMRAVNIKYY